MKVLITGVPGWLGNRLVEVLMDGYEGEGPAAAWNVRCLALEGDDARLAEGFAGAGKLELVRGDVTRPATLDAAVRGVDVVVHAAGVIHPRRVTEFYEVNARGTANLLDACARAGVKKFVYVSSNSAAGTNARRGALMTEADEPRPYLHYGRSKRLAEIEVLRHRDLGSFRTVILRPCWYYGPYQPERQTAFFRMIREGRPLLFGDGNNLRSMTYIDNACRAIVLAAGDARADGQTYWVADERPYRMNEIYAAVAESVGTGRLRPRRVPGAVSEMCLLADRALQSAGLYVKEIHVAGEMNKNIACSIDKAVRELGYRPAVSLREGMRRSVEWCRARGEGL